MNTNECHSNGDSAKILFFPGSGGSGGSSGDVFKACVLVSDGQPYDIEYTDGKVKDFCNDKFISTCTAQNIAAWMKNRDYNILGIIVGGAGNARETMWDYSSCTGTYVDGSGCDWFMSANDFTDLQSRTTALAQSLTTLVGVTTTTTTQEEVTEQEVTEQETEIMNDQIKKLLDMQVISETTDQEGFFSNLFTKRKSDGSYRSILNLKK